ncbi:hypothetical protein QKG53_14505 [Clavibacter michiganensis]|uniref:hypothetical protein n=1 Tax=Clavibacter michiganensis TaxID=28447 RepID=UPI0026DC4031|nr:hypothetical protein [Clavibacter michiganensis]MDO4058031.1 hypothetical protein [Clavibacter michiganensis]MDO4061054.1 hypothetical protein [Clavibacter michiganensis]
MASHAYPFPVAVSQLEGDDSREAQTARAVKWLVAQPGGPVAVVTPRRRVEDEALKALLAVPGTTHHIWRGLSVGSLTGRRVLHAWPDTQRLNAMWGVDADALVVIEWGLAETAEWVEDSNALLLRPGQVLTQVADEHASSTAGLAPLPDDVSQILEITARMAAGYDSGLQWNEEHKLKADMMNRPDRWAAISPEQVRARCRELEMRPADVDTIVGFVRHRQEGRRFAVRGSYRDFQFR